MSQQDAAQDSGSDNTTMAQSNGWLTRLFSLLSSITGTVFFIAATFSLLITWFGFGISPFDKPATLEQSNTLADEYVEVGNTFLDADELEAAREEFDRALELAPSHRDAQLGAFKTDVFFDVTRGEPATASTSISEDRITRQRILLLLEEYPDDADALTYLACMTPNAEAALEIFQRAVAIDPKQALAYSGMADIYSAQGKLDKSLKMSKRAYESAPWKSIFHNNYAYALSVTERPQDAINEYEDLLFHDPEYLWAYNDLANLYRLTGDLHTSYSYGQTFIELSADEQLSSLNGDEVALYGPDKNPVYLTEGAEKKYYSYYNIALTSYLLGRAGTTDSYLNKAKDIQVNPFAESEIKRLMAFHIKRLKTDQKQFSARADDFQTKFL